MWGTWTRRWDAALAITRGDGCLPMRIGTWYDVALRRCFQVTEELVWELFTQAGPVGEPPCRDSWQQISTCSAPH